MQSQLMINFPRGLLLALIWEAHLQMCHATMETMSTFLNQLQLESPFKHHRQASAYCGGYGLTLSFARLCKTCL